MSEYPLNDRIGLCTRCSHARVHTSAKGSEFWRCALADRNDAFPRYPPLPVTVCDGFRPR